MRPGVNRSLTALCPVPTGTRAVEIRERFDGGDGSGDGGPDVGYRHFCDHFRPEGDPKKCTQCNKCNLWESEDTEQVLRRAKEEAERKWRETEKAWGEAVKRSDRYKDQLHRSQMSSSLSASVLGPRPDQSQSQSQSQKKRRISVPLDAASAQVRRIKRRKSNQFVQPLTDDALAQRLQEVCL